MGAAPASDGAAPGLELCCESELLLSAGQSPVSAAGATASGAVGGGSDADGEPGAACGCCGGGTAPAGTGMSGADSRGAGGARNTADPWCCWWLLSRGGGSGRSGANTWMPKSSGTSCFWTRFRSGSLLHEPMGSLETVDEWLPTALGRASHSCLAGWRACWLRSCAC